MTTRIECDFRHGLADPKVTRGPFGQTLCLVHGQTSITVALSEASLRALWLAVVVAIPGDEE